MNLPVDQRLLYRDLVAKLDGLESEAALIHYMGGVLGSLLRRRGDADFLRQVQDAFTTGLSGIDRPEQTQLARQVIGLVIAKRPEVAQAWQKLHNEPPRAFARRSSDQEQASQVAVPELDDLPEFALTPEEEDEIGQASGPDDPYGRARLLLAEDLSQALGRMLALFAIPEARSPSPVYDHDHPFFLFTPQFPHVAARFLNRLLAGPARAEVELEIYARLPSDTLADDTALRAALKEARPRVWALLANQLTLLAGLHHSAQAKLAAANGGGKAQAYQKVQVPVSVPRVIHVLGLSFSLGHRQALKTMRIPVEGSNQPDPAETEAVELAMRWTEMAARSGLSLPDACDFGFLRALLQTDVDSLSRQVPPLAKMAAELEGDHEALLTKLKTLDDTFPPGVVEAVALLLFRHGASGCFGFQELLDFTLAPSPLSPRRLLLEEIGRRPRDLAFQLRDALRSRMDRNRLGLAIVMLFEVWRAMDRDRFHAELQAALTVFSAFPVAFAGDPDEKIFTEIGTVLFQVFSAPQLDASGTIETVLKIYGPALNKG